MDFLNSDWLIHMLKKAGNTPQARMLSLFDILDDWTDAPGVSAQFELMTISQTGALQNYLSMEAAKAGAALPEMLAMQLYVMAVSAYNEKLQIRPDGNKDKDSSELILHAKNAASALISAQTKKEFRISKFSAYAIAASFLGAMIVASSIFIFNKNHVTDTPQIALAESLTQPVVATHEFIANPEDTAALIAQINQMRKGSCQLIEAIQLPDSYKKVYFENIVLGQISTDPSEQKLVRELLQKVRCNYTPMLMANSTG